MTHFRFSGKFIFSFFVLLMCNNCVVYQPASMPDHKRFDWLYERQLAAFEHQLALEVQLQQTDDFTSIGHAWSAFVNCTDVDDAIANMPAPSDPLAQFLLESLHLEEMRRHRLLHTRGITPTRATRRSKTQMDLIHQPDFFFRTFDAIPEGYIVWLPADEKWTDELPTASSSISQCEKFIENASKSNDIEALHSLHEEEYSQIDALLESALQLPDEMRKGQILRAESLIRFHAAMLTLESARLEPLPGEDIAVDSDKFSWSHRALGYLEDVAERVNTFDHFETFSSFERRELAQMMYLHAALLVRIGQSNQALPSLQLAQSLGLEENRYWHARYLHLKVLTDSARWTDAARLSTALPPSNHPVFAAYAYRAASVVRRIDALDQYLALVMAIFRDVPYQANPFLGALYVDALNALVEFPFDEHMLEILEDLGPRNQILQRIEEFAHIAIDRRYAENAIAAAHRLLNQQPNAQHHPRYYAILALGAFINDDATTFSRWLNEITHRPAHLMEALPMQRRSGFFAHADAELARVLRQMLPIMAEWGDNRAAQRRRQNWLTMITMHIQQFLQNTPETLARPALVELYRVSSALLKDHPRGYVERVGQLEPAPLILGHVTVSSRNLEPYEPDTFPIFDPVFSLTLIPRDHQEPWSWPLGWSPEAGGGQ